MGSGGARGEGTGAGRGRDTVDGLFGAGAAAGIFLVFMWIVGIPKLLAGIGMVATSENGYVYYSSQKSLGLFLSQIWHFCTKLT